MRSSRRAPSVARRRGRGGIALVLLAHAAAAALGLLPASSRPAAAQDNLYGEGAQARPDSKRSRPAEVYVPPALPWEGPLPEAALEVAGSCRLGGEPVSSPAWVDDARLAVATEEPEGEARWLHLCRLPDALPVWSVSLPRPTVGTPAADSERVYVLLASGEVLAFDVESGRQVWSALAQEGAPAGLAYVDSSLVVGTSAGLLALEPADGRVRFVAVPGSPPALPPADCGGRWVVAFSSGSVRALEPREGRLLWERALRGVPAAPACEDGSRVVVGTSARELVALTSERGRRAWKQRLGGAVAVPPVLHEGGVYAGSMDGRVYGFKESSGHRMWSVPVGERVRRAPVRVAGLLAVAAAGETRLSLIHLPSGRLLLEAEAPPEAAAWAGAPAARGERLALAADRRDSPGGQLIVYRVVVRAPEESGR